MEEMDANLKQVAKYLSRYDFLNRIVAIQYLSYRSIGFDEDFKKQKKRAIQSLEPWEIETIATIFLYFNHCSKIHHTFPSKDFDNDINNVFEILGSGKCSFPPRYKELMAKYGPYAILGPLMHRQKYYQDFFPAKMFRYYYLFSFDPVVKDFIKEKIGEIDFRYLYFLGSLPVGLKEAVSQDYPEVNSLEGFKRYQDTINIILPKVSNYLELLSITLEDLIKQQSEKCDMMKLNEIIYSYKVINEKPFLKNDSNYYFITSHSLEYACTDGLFLSLTNGEKHILDHMGSTVVESYMNDIIRESKMYTTIPKKDIKKKYYVTKSHNHDPEDAVFKSGDCIVFMEIKECLPKRKISINDVESIELMYERIVSATKQCLDNYHNFKAGYYNPFNDDGDKTKNVFLIVATLLYMGVSRDRIIKDVIKDPKYQNDKQLLEEHYVITDFHVLELYFLYKDDVLEDLKKKQSEKKLNEFGSSHGEKLSSKRITSFDAFIERSTKLSDELLTGNKNGEQE